jgi:hypothetical protein
MQEDQEEDECVSSQCTTEFADMAQFRYRLFFCGVVLFVRVWAKTWP